MKEIRKPRINLDFDKEDKLLLTRFYTVWARKLWEAKLVFYSLEINFAFFSNDKYFDNYHTEESIQEWFKRFLNEFGKLEFIEVVHGASNFNKSGMLQVQFILGFRPHFHLVSFIKIKIEDLLVIYNKEALFKLVYLSNFRGVVDSLCYLSRNFDKPRTFSYAFAGIYSCFYTKTHNDMFLPICWEQVDFGLNTTFFIYGECYCDEGYEYQLSLGKFHEIGSVPQILLQEEFGEILYYLIYYFQKQKIIKYKKKLYLYSKKTGWSNEMLSIFEFFIKEKIMNILIEIKKIFDFINIESLYFLFCKHNKTVIIKLIFYLKTKNMLTV
jgi:hypothetical protein